MPSADEPLPGQPGQLPWSQGDWFEEVTAWIQNILAQQHIRLAGTIEQPHVRPWSTVLRVPTDSGVVFMKATAPVLGHEAALTAALARWRPDCMPEVLAVDQDRSWLLLRNAGTALRGLLQQTGEIAHWQRILPLYAEVQIELADRSEELLALGVMDRRLAGLPTRFVELLDDVTMLCVDHEDGLSAAEYTALQAMAPLFAEMCKALERFGLPETLQHDDFHDGNIFVDGRRYTFADWGESCLAHPFFTLVVTLRSAAYTLHLNPTDPAIDRLRHAYLEPWTQYGSMAMLLEAFELANQIGIVNRALTWHRVVAVLEEPYRSQQADAVPGWLHEFLTAQSGR